MDSSTSIPAPSPRIKPLRSFEKGRQVSEDTTRIASHAFSSPMLNGASLPPVMAASTWPLRTIQNACPMAWLAEEQAVEIVNAGPEMPSSMEILLVPALAMLRGMVRGWTRLEFSLYRETKPASWLDCPPRHEPVTTAILPAASGAILSPESASACRAAINANWEK